MEQELTDSQLELNDSLIDEGDSSATITEAPTPTGEIIDQPDDESLHERNHVETVELDIESRVAPVQNVGFDVVELDAGSQDSQKLDEASAVPVVYRDQDEVIGDPFVPLPYTPTSSGEDIRRSGLAWSAGVAFFGSVAFTLFLGWLADLLLGTSPWGIVGGIVLGSMIGFLQFFRITSRIFPGKNNVPSVSPLMSSKDDDQV